MVIDSHVLLWWLESPGKLSADAAREMKRLEAGESGFQILSVTFWELRLKELRGQFEPKMPVREWPALLGRIPNLEIIDIDADLWLRSAEIRWEHRDPADRLIAAAALRKSVPVITKDSRFHEPGCPVKAVW